MSTSGSYSPAEPTRLRTLAATLTAVAVLTALLALAHPAPAGASVSTVSVSTSQVSETEDFATTEFANPWDFADSVDVKPYDGLGTDRLSSVSISGGTLSAQSLEQGNIMLLRSWDRGGIPWGRDGDLHPIDASKYTHISFRMKSHVTSVIGGGHVDWFDCGQTRPECSGGTTFLVHPGWHTYVVELDENIGWPVQWAGLIRGMRLVFGNTVGPVEIDWVRLYKPTAPVTVSVTDTTPSTDAMVYWDRDNILSNNTPDNRNWGSLGIASGGSVSFPASAYPPGTYRFYAVDDGATSGYSPTMRINRRPRPVVIDPDIAGGADYATTVRGDAWDMSQPSDVAWLTNATGSVSGGNFVGANAPPVRSDSQVFLPVAGTIDANRWHRLTARVWFDGDFGLSALPGGGMNARVIWGVGDSNFRDSDDLVIEPGWNTINLDLSELEGEDVTLSGSLASGPANWSGAVNLFRIDPHEDEGIRDFRIDYVHLREDDRGTGKFDIRFRDYGHEPGTVARIYADNDNVGFNGTLIGTVNVVNGVNTFTWWPTAAQAGTKWIHIEMTDPAGGVASSYSTGPVTVTHDPNGPPGIDPVGHFDNVVNVPAGLRIQGWSYDGDRDTKTTVNFYMDGQLVKQSPSGKRRLDVQRKFPDLPHNTGFGRIFSAPPGVHEVCVVALNQNSGRNTHLGCKTVVREDVPVGELELVTRVGNVVRVVGWTLDPNNDDDAVTRVLVDGKRVGSFLADDPRPDIIWSRRNYGNIGFDDTVTVGPGTHQVCVWAINVQWGTHNTRLGCSTI